MVEAGGDVDEGASPRRRSRRFLALMTAAKLALFVLLVVGVALLIDPEEFRDMLTSVSLGAIVLFTLFMLASQALMSLRWTLIARQQLGLREATFGYLFRTALLAEFASIWLPSSLAGEGLRVLRLTSVTGKLSESTASIILDRVSGVLSLLICCMAFAPLLLRYRDKLPFSPSLGLLALVGGALGLLLVPLVMRRYSGTLASARKAAEMLRSAPLLSLPLLVSFAGFAAILLGYHVLLIELANVTLAESGLISIGSRLGRFIPVSLFGVGGVEGATYLLAELVGVGAEAIVVLVAINVLVKYIVASIGVLLELAVSGKEAVLTLLRPGGGAGEAREAAEPGGDVAG
ncbi:MAG: flippase-like domain-containing protein [Myxococcales bacterium]|nr:flippase-like domain-containing protein [Myxococcales bacterium]